MFGGRATTTAHYRDAELGDEPGGAGDPCRWVPCASRPYAESGNEKPPKLLVSMTATPTSRKEACTARTTSGRVTLSSSLHPSRSSPPKSSAVRPACCKEVPMAPSYTTTRLVAALT